MSETVHKIRAAVLLDRDGVLIEDIHLLTRFDQVRILPGVHQALRRLKTAGFALVAVSNQPVVARGLTTEQEVALVHEKITEQLSELGAPRLDAWYFCPHHPNATIADYRLVCECRKPRPGMILQAAREHQLDLARSFLVGDRLTDIIAGAKAGCRTVLVQTGRHGEPPIQTVESLDNSIQPDYTCADLSAAVDWILRVRTVFE